MEKNQIEEKLAELNTIQLEREYKKEELMLEISNNETKIKIARNSIASLDDKILTTKIEVDKLSNALEILDR